jgi:hypothetical protein
VIEVGQKVKFDPFKGLHDGRGLPLVSVVVTGTVVDVHEDHNWFSVEYVDEAGTKQRISFNFHDIGTAVEVVN